MTFGVSKNPAGLYPLDNRSIIKKASGQAEAFYFEKVKGGER